jgi:hypothetical protein
MDDLLNALGYATSWLCAVVLVLLLVGMVSKGDDDE